MIKKSRKENKISLQYILNKMSQKHMSIIILSFATDHVALVVTATFFCYPFCISVTPTSTSSGLVFVVVLMFYFFILK